MGAFLQFLNCTNDTKPRTASHMQRNHTKYFITERISSLAPNIWELVSCEIKNPESLDIFYEKIKIWTTIKCPYRLYKKYISNIGFI